MKPTSVKMADRTTWYECSKCGAAWENRKEALNCCTEVEE